MSKEIQDLPIDQNANPSGAPATTSTLESAKELLRQAIAEGNIGAAVTYIQNFAPKGSAAQEAPTASKDVVITEDQRQRLIKLRKQLMKDERDEIWKLRRRREKLENQVNSLQRQLDSLQRDLERARTKVAPTSEPLTKRAEVVASEVMEPQPFSTPNGKEPPPFPDWRPLPPGWSRTRVA